MRELLATIVGFRGIGQDLDKHARVCQRVFVFGVHFGFGANDTCIGIREQPSCKDPNGQVGIENPTSFSKKQVPKFPTHGNFESRMCYGSPGHVVNDPVEPLVPSVARGLEGDEIRVGHVRLGRHAAGHAPTVAQEPMRVQAQIDHFRRIGAVDSSSE